LLNKSFGLDHSYAAVASEVDPLLQSSSYLTADQFVTLVCKHGVISCYETIPPEELEILKSDVADFCETLTGEFEALVQPSREPACVEPATR
jgi:hypothetical protein